jgi:hypothetical protein
MTRSLPHLISLGLTAGLLTVFSAPAQANKLDAVTQRLGNACKLRVVEQFDVSMAEARISLGATLKQSLDSGAMTMKDVKASGLSFDWAVTGKSAKGYCNVNYDGTVSEFKQW